MKPVVCCVCKQDVVGIADVSKCGRVTHTYCTKDAENLCPKLKAGECC